MKKIMNQPETMVMEMCSGMVIAHPQLAFSQKFKVLKKRHINQNKVTLISGGGSGHEPMHAGFIGQGMLDAAVCGDVFASPSQIQVYQAIKQTASQQGTLLIIKNYSGDMMNFKNAASLAAEDGIQVDYVKVDDDIAVEDSLYTVGRRGVAGTVLVHKIAGAAAENALPLSEVKRLAEHAASCVRSLGFAFSSCTVPAKGSPTFEIADDEIEFGVGIHGEPGIKREKMATADELALRVTGALLDDLHIDEDDSRDVALLINGFGSTPLQELYLLANAVAKVLTGCNVHIYRSFVGNFTTSIDMLGASVSIMKLDRELKILLNQTCDTPALKVSGASEPVDPAQIYDHTAQLTQRAMAAPTDEAYARIVNDRVSLENLIYLVDRMGQVIIDNEVPFCVLDSHAGDGDFGMSVAKGFKQLKREWGDILAQEPRSMAAFLHACSMVIMEHCGGASGPIWGSAFRFAAKSVEGKASLSVADFAHLMQAAVQGVQATGERSFGRGAVVGDKTLIDALVPCANAWSHCAADHMSFHAAFSAAANAAVQGAKSTERIVARMGRAGTVGERSLGYPDAGAHALGVIFTEIAKCIK